MREPSTIDISPAARQVAEAAAERAGLSVEHWLSRVIAQAETPRQNNSEPPRRPGVVASIQRPLGDLRPNVQVAQRPLARIDDARGERPFKDMDEFSRSLKKLDGWIQNQQRMEETVARLAANLSHLADMVWEMKEERSAEPFPRSKRYG